MSITVGIVGLGRVGRSMLRTNFIQSKPGRFNIAVLCDVMPISQVAYLIAHDSTYGKSPFSVDFKGDYLFIAGKRIRYLQVDRRQGLERNCDQVTLRDLNIDVLINATGTAVIDDLRKLAFDLRPSILFFVEQKKQWDFSDITMKGSIEADY